MSNALGPQLLQPREYFSVALRLPCRSRRGLHFNELTALPLDFFEGFGALVNL